MNAENTVSPDPPTGYQLYNPDQDPSLGTGARVVLTGWVVAVVVILVFIWLNHERFSLRLLWIFLATVLVHEGIHAIVGYLLGLRVRLMIEVDGVLSGPAILAYGDFLTCYESVLLSAAPILVVSPICLLLMVVGNPTVVLAALGAMFVNTVGAVGDVGQILDSLTLPSNTLEYYTSEDDVKYYVPADSSDFAR
jgi:hypothetical protein